MARILVVDDSSFMRNSLKFIIENGGHNVVGIAKDGKEAIELYKKLKPDIVTLDILMKNMDGIESLKEIMKIDPDARIIMVTAIGLESKQEITSKLGAKGYIRKPFRQTEILQCIDNILQT